VFRKTLDHVLKRIPSNLSSLYTEAPPLAWKIPNHVYQTWRSPVVPELMASQVRRFRRMNFDCSYSFFNNERMASYMESAFAEHPILQVFRDIQMPAEKADIWRYCILFREGGIYCDIKSVLTVPFRTLLADDPLELISFEGNRWKDCLDLERCADPAVFQPVPPDSVKGLLDHPDLIVLNWLLCFEKGSPILEEVIGLIVRHAPFYRRKTFEIPEVAGSHFTGPIALTQAVWKWIQKAGRRPAQCGIDFSGHGIWKVDGMVYRGSPHHSKMKDMVLLADDAALDRAGGNQGE
jgi:hypothetical protein